MVNCWFPPAMWSCREGSASKSRPIAASPPPCAVVGVLDGTGSVRPAGRPGAGLAVPGPQVADQILGEAHGSLCRNAVCRGAETRRSPGPLPSLRSYTLCSRRSVTPEATLCPELIGHSTLLRRAGPASGRLVNFAVKVPRSAHISGTLEFGLRPGTAWPFHSFAPLQYTSVRASFSRRLCRVSCRRNRKDYE